MAQINTDLETLKTARDNMKLALEGQGQTVTKDIRTYAQAISNISGGGSSGDVKLFDTIENMQQDPSPNEGDLAVVYREELQPVTSESEFDSCIFPNEVVLSEAFTSSIYGSFRSTGGGFFDGMVDMSSSSFRFDGFGDTMIRVEYTSQDGITYTRTDSGEELVEFGTTIKWESGYGEFNSVIGNFMKIGGNYFDGLYEYKSINEPLPNGYKSGDLYSSDLNMSKIIVKDLDIDYEYLKSLIDTNVYNRNGFKFYPKIIVDWEEKYDSENNITYIEAKKWYCIYGSSYGTSYWHFFYLNNNYIRYTPAIKITSSLNNAGIPFITFNNGTYTYIDKIDTDVSNVSFYGRADELLSLEQTDMPFDNSKGFILYYDNIESGQGGKCLLGDENNAVEYSAQLFDGNGDTEKYYNNFDFIKYSIVSSQIDTTSDYVYEKTFYGKNGVENGTLTTNVSNSFADVNAEVFAKIQQQYDNMQPRVLTDQDKTVNTSTKIIPIKSDGTSLLDTSNVTDFTNMFNNCRELKIIAPIDTSNATKLSSTFGGCFELKTIPSIDTSNVTKMDYTFYNCKELVSIPSINTSNVTNMLATFGWCEKLITIPALDTTNVTTMQEMFYYCKSLTSIPLLNTSNVIDTHAMFQNCIAMTTIPLLDMSGVTTANCMFGNCKLLTSIPAFNLNSLTDGREMFCECSSVTEFPVFTLTNITDMSLMFGGCSSLTNTGLNNILATCITATNVTSTNKTLKYIGLTSEQATTCQSLSNWSACQSAGWTTGY